MKSKRKDAQMPRSILFGAVATALVATSAPLMPVMAADPYGTPYSAAAPDDRAAITVLAPRVRRDRSSGPIPTETISTQAVVYIDDLDLRTASGRDELDMRVRSAAREACDWLDEVYPMSEPVGSSSCESDAIKTAQRQVDDAINSYGG